METKLNFDKKNSIQKGNLVWLYIDTFAYAEANNRIERNSMSAEILKSVMRADAPSM